MAAVRPDFLWTGRQHSPSREQMKLKTQEILHGEFWAIRSLLVSD
jgi:hypothetical protein